MFTNCKKFNTKYILIFFLGFGTVYLALEKAAKNLAKSIADETVSVVQHKWVLFYLDSSFCSISFINGRFCLIINFRYGKEVGTATENALYATGNLGLTVNNARNLGVKAIAKRAAKDTGKAVVEDYKKKKRGAGKLDAGKKNPTEDNRQPSSGGARPPGAGLDPK